MGHHEIGRTDRIIFCSNCQSSFHNVGLGFPVHDALNEDSACLVGMHSCHVPLLIPFAGPAGPSHIVIARAFRCLISIMTYVRN